MMERVRMGQAAHRDCRFRASHQPDIWQRASANHGGWPGLSGRLGILAVPGWQLDGEGRLDAHLCCCDGRGDWRRDSVVGRTPAQQPLRVVACSSHCSDCWQQLRCPVQRARCPVQLFWRIRSTGSLPRFRLAAVFPWRLANRPVTVSLEGRQQDTNRNGVSS